MKIKIELQSLGDDGYHIFCKVKVNGKKCRALIDTGASKTVIGKKLIKKLKVEEFKPQGLNQMTGIHPGEMDVAFARIESISFGTLKFKNIITGLIDLEHVNMQYKTLKIEPFQLIIGGDILAKGKAVIDYKNKLLKLEK
ncbi:MAG: retropepsin-like aspartic protease [Bacteroidia bacterium]